MKINRVFLTAVVVAGMVWAGGARAGSLTPPSAPAPTMHTLEEIYQQLLTTQQQVANLEARMNADGKQVTVGNMVLIPAGSYVMGATTNVGHEFGVGDWPQHTVNISAFYMERHEVTSNLWREVYTWATNKGFAFANIGLSKTNSHPVHSVNWYDTLAWCNARSQRDGFTPCYTNAGGAFYTNSSVAFAGGCNWSATGYRLPTEAEWEKAARGGVANRRFPWNDANTILHARANYYAVSSFYSYDISPTLTYHPSSGAHPATMAVGSFAPNGYGLYDMAGNVWEWCWDWIDPNYYSVSPVTNPTGPASGEHRVKRGGSWDDAAVDARCSARLSLFPNDKNNLSGFRCARGL